MVPPGLRAEVRARRLAAADGSSSARHLVAMCALYAALAAIGLAAGNLWTWAVICPLLALVLVGPLALMHEGVHHNLFGAKWANHLVGSLSAAVIALPAPAYRAFHLTHHANTLAEDDSEPPHPELPSKVHYLGYMAIFGVGFVAILWAGTLGALVGRPPKWVRTAKLRAHVRRWTIVPTAVLAALIAAAVLWPAAMVPVWLVPLAVFQFVLFPVVSLPEHFEGREADGLLSNTRTNESNAVMRWLYWNNNYHAAHHVVPSVSPHRLGELDGLIRTDNPMRSSGFVAFHAQQLAARPLLPGR